MATFLRKTDPLQTCPYNPAHRILQSRLQLHLVKCQKDHIDVEKMTCPFNAQHVLDPKKYRAHIQVCPDRDVVDRQILQSNEDNEYRGALSVPPTVPIPSEITYREVWELNEKPVAGYVPKKNVGGPIDSAHFKPAVKKLMYQGKIEDEEENAPIAKPAPIVEEPKIVQPVKEMELLKHLRGSRRSKLAANLPLSSAQPRFFQATSVTAELANLKIGKGRGGIVTQK